MTKPVLLQGGEKPESPVVGRCSWYVCVAAKAQACWPVQESRKILGWKGAYMCVYTHISMYIGVHRWYSKAGCISVEFALRSLWKVCNLIFKC